MNFTDYFPEGCRILFFDPKKKSRDSISTLLTSSSYKVRTFVDARTIHRVLGEYGSHFDLILCNAGTAHGASMDLLRIYGGTFPVVLLSENPNKKAMIRAAKMGACDFLLAPFTPQAFSTLWQHCVRKMVEQQAGEQRLRIPDAKPTNKRSCTQKGTEPADKKVGRHDWTEQEKQAFNNLDEQIGVKEATPEVIHELMNNPSQTRDHVKRQLEEVKRKAVAERLRRESYQRNQQVSPSYHGFPQQPADPSIFNKDFWDDNNLAQEHDQPQLQRAWPLFVDNDVTNLKTGMENENEEAPPLTVDEFLEEIEMGNTRYYDY